MWISMDRGISLETPSSTTPAEQHDAALRDACAQFEAMLFAKMFEAMRESVPKDGLIPRASGEQLFQGMLDGEYALQVARSQPAGVAAALYAQLRDGVPEGTPRVP